MSRYLQLTVSYETSDAGTLSLRAASVLTLLADSSQDFSNISAGKSLLQLPSL